MLLFDEPDALSGKRTAGHVANDRYANIESEPAGRACPTGSVAERDAPNVAQPTRNPV